MHQRDGRSNIVIHIKIHQRVAPDLLYLEIHTKIQKRESKSGSNAHFFRLWEGVGVGLERETKIKPRPLTKMSNKLNFQKMTPRSDILSATN